MKIIFKNCKIYDGTGAEPFHGVVVTEGERITYVGPEVAPAAAERSEAALSAELAAVASAAKDSAAAADSAADAQVIDLGGKSIAPGFIDIHSHNDWFAIKNDKMKYFEPFIRQGITTFVGGNCGISAFGFDRGTAHMDAIGGGLFNFDNAGSYATFGEFRDALDGNVPCNMAALVGHCTARGSASGNANRPLTEEEEQEMLGLLEKALQEGAAGISLGLMYEPGLYADVNELKKVAALCLKYDKILTVHPRAESKVSLAYPELLGRSHLLRAFDELREISKGTNLKLQYSHAIFVGRHSFGAKQELLEIMDAMRKEGVDVKFDIYNETLGVSVITVVLPGWFQNLSEKEKHSFFNRLKLRVLCTASSALLGFGFDDIVVAYLGEGLEEFEGKSVHAIAKELGKSDFDTYLMLCEKSNFKGRVNMGPYSTREVISEFEKNPNCLYMTDAWVEDHGVQNPAIYDCFPKFLQDALNGTGDTLPATIHRMTGASAARYMLKDRGLLKVGCFADLTVFDEEELKTATPDQTKSFGIDQVYVNGKLVFGDGEIQTGACGCGHVISV